MLRNWKEFLRDDDNKTEVFSFLILKTASLESEKNNHTPKDILFTQPRNTTGLASSLHPGRG